MKTDSSYKKFSKLDHRIHAHSTREILVCFTYIITMIIFLAPRLDCYSVFRCPHFNLSALFQYIDFNISLILTTIGSSAGTVSSQSTDAEDSGVVTSIGTTGILSGLLTKKYTQYAIKAIQPRMSNAKVIAVQIPLENGRSLHR